jgi:uncharacterized protein
MSLSQPTADAEGANKISNKLSFCPRSKVMRAKKRASYDRQQVYELIDQLKTGHLAFVEDGEPRCIPITVWRWQDSLYFHVLQGGRLSRQLGATDVQKADNNHPEGPTSGKLLCISFAQTSEWVMSKSAYHHSANYQSAVLFGRATEVTDEVHFDRAFQAIIEQLEPGRWRHIRAPSDKERKATALFCLPIEEGSFKARTGGPNEEPEDMSLAVWHGTLPVMP